MGKQYEKGWAHGSILARIEGHEHTTAVKIGIAKKG
jgi:hypothetical protein